MLREISRDDVKMRSGNILILYNEALYTLEELWDVLNVRFLVDEPETDETDPEETEPKETPKRRRKSPEEIKQMIANEDPRKPLSDAAIAQKLADNGLDIARRTVAKYRESMNIPPTNLRRKH